MADFVIRPAGDPDWGNARFLSGPLPLAAVDAASAGLSLDTDYEIGRIGSLTTFQVTQTDTAPTLIGSEPGVIALWDAHDMPDGPVATLSDLAGPFDLTAIAAPTASGGVITFDGVGDVLLGADFPDDTGAQIPGARHVRDYTLPDASGGDAGQGFSIAGFAYDDADGTWWAVNGGLNYDGSSSDRQQSLVHLSSDFSLNLGEIDLDAVLPDLDTDDESPQAVAVDNANGYLWVGSPSARVIHCFDKATGARLPANDITRSYDIGSLAIAESGDAIWVMSLPPGDATIQKISTDGTVTVSVDFTIDLDARHDHLTEKGGLLYVSCGTNGAQAFVTAVDPVQETVLGRAMLPYPGGAMGMVGIEGIQFGQNGSVFIAHNGYFHYGDPGDPAAPDQWPRSNIVAEYMLPDLGGADFDMFALVDVAPSGADCLMQFGSALDATKLLPAAGIFPEDGAGWQLRVNNASGGASVVEPDGFSGVTLLYVERRGADVTFYVNGVAGGSATLATDGAGAWGPVHPPMLGGAHTNTNRYTAMDFHAAGVVLGSAANRQLIEGALAHRHGQAALLPVGHPFKDVAPTSGDVTPLPDFPAALPAPAVPDAFADADWSVATGANGALDVTIAALPAANGAPVADIEYDLDGSGIWVSSGETGNFTISGLTPGAPVAVRLRAVNAVGAGAAGNSESAAAGDTPSAGTLTIDSLTYTRGEAGVPPSVTARVSGTGTLAGPFTLRGVFAGSAQTPAQIDAGPDTFGIGPKASLAALDNAALDIGNSVTGGVLSVYVTDSSGAPAVSAVATETGVTYDRVPPAPASAEVGSVDARSLIITLTKDGYGAVSGSDFAVLVNGSPVTVSAASVTGTSVDLTLASAVSGGDTVTVAYTGSSLVGIDAEPMAVFAAQPVTNTATAPGPGIGAPVRLLATPYSDSSEASATHTTATVTPTGGRPLAIVVHMQAGITGSETPSAATFGGVDVTPHETITNNSRVHTFIYVVENPGTSAQAFSITMPSAPRSMVIEILEVPGAATSATVGNAMTPVAGTADTAAISGTTGADGSLVLYAMTRRYLDEVIASSGTDGRLSQHDSGDTSAYRDVQTLIAWSVVPTAGAATATFSWPTSDEHAVVGIELEAA
jgi:uncharacterized repeat protein (TIGR02059 family)